MTGAQTELRWLDAVLDDGEEPVRPAPRLRPLPESEPPRPTPTRTPSPPLRRPKPPAIAAPKASPWRPPPAAFALVASLRAHDRDDDAIDVRRAIAAGPAVLVERLEAMARTERSGHVRAAIERAIVSVPRGAR